MTAGQLYFIIFLIFASDAATWKVHSWYTGNQETKELQEAITAKQTAEAKATKIAHDYESKVAILTTQNQNLSKEWTNARLKKYVPDCALPNTALQLLKGNAISPVAPAR